jgi:hypothetical protein
MYFKFDVFFEWPYVITILKLVVDHECFGICKLIALVCENHVIY